MSVQSQCGNSKNCVLGSHVHLLVFAVAFLTIYSLVKKNQDSLDTAVCVGASFALSIRTLVIEWMGYLDNSLYMKYSVAGATFLGAIALAVVVSAASANLSLVADGSQQDFLTKPKNASSHYSLVDEGVCNGTSDYVYTRNSGSNNGKQDSYVVDLSAIPVGATIDSVTVTPCASRNSDKNNGSSELGVHASINGSQYDAASTYALVAGNSPSALSPTEIAVGETVNGSTALEIGVEYVSGNRGVRVSQLDGFITYSIGTSTGSSTF